MEPKYDIKRMLQEIKADEALSPRTARKISQDEIRKRVARKRKESPGGR